MNNVPSSMLLAVIGIVAAVIVGTGVIATTFTMQESGTKTAGEVTSQVIAISSELNIENGDTISGSQVKSCIQTNGQEEISLKVNNGTATQSYYYTLDGNNELDERVDVTDAKRAIQSKDKSEYYINPTDTYVVQFVYGKKTGGLTGVLFQRKDSAKLNKTDGESSSTHDDIATHTIKIVLNPSGGNFDNLTDSAWTKESDGTISRTFTAKDTGKFSLPIPTKTEGVFKGWYNDTQKLSKTVTINMGDAAYGTSSDQTITYNAQWESAVQGEGTYEIQYFFMKKDGTYSNAPDETLDAANTTTGNIVRTNPTMVSPTAQNFDDDDSEEAKSYKKLYALYENGDYIYDSSNTKNVLQGTVTGDGQKLRLKVYFKRCYSIQIVSGGTGNSLRTARGFASISYIGANGEVLDGSSLTEEEKNAYKTVSFSDTDNSVKVPYGEDPLPYIKKAVGENVSFTEGIPTWNEIKSTVVALPEFPDLTVTEASEEIVAYASALPTYTTN